MRPPEELDLKEGEIVVKKGAVDEFHGMMKIPKKLADETEMWD